LHWATSIGVLQVLRSGLHCRSFSSCTCTPPAISGGTIRINFCRQSLASIRIQYGEVHILHEAIYNADVTDLCDSVQYCSVACYRVALDRCVNFAFRMTWTLIKGLLYSSVVLTMHYVMNRTELSWYCSKTSAFCWAGLVETNNSSLTGANRRGHHCKYILINFTSFSVLIQARSERALKRYEYLQYERQSKKTMYPPQTWASGV
jgi:hypothetical protein